MKQRLAMLTLSIIWLLVEVAMVLPNACPNPLT